MKSPKPPANFIVSENKVGLAGLELTDYFINRFSFPHQVFTGKKQQHQSPKHNPISELLVSQKARLYSHSVLE
jgi:hypothetical protein